MSNALNAEVGILLGKALGELNSEPLRTAAGAIDILKPALAGVSRETAHAATLAGVLIALRGSGGTGPATPPPPAPAAALAPAPPPPRRKPRKRKLPSRYRADGTMGADWIDDELGPVLTQRGACEMLGLNRAQLLMGEERGKLPRVISNGKVAYRVADVEAVAELLRKAKERMDQDAANQSTTEDKRAVADAA